MRPLTAADFFSPVLDDMPPEWEAAETHLLAKLAPLSRSLTPAQYERLEAIARSRWYLLRNDGPAAAPARCVNCRRIHDYYTTACVERPLHGLQDVMGAIETVTGRDVSIEYLPLGTIEPITAGEAAKLLDRIRSRPMYCRRRKEPQWSAALS